MNQTETYIIPFARLEDGEHVFDYELKKTFFDSFDLTDIRDGQMQVRIDLHKLGGAVWFDYVMKGQVSVQCDRCLDEIIYPLDFSGKVGIVSSGLDEEKEQEDQMMEEIPVEEGAGEVDVSFFMYESILLQLPLQRIHGNNSEGVSMCNKEMLGLLQKYAGEKKEEKIDSRWEELLKYKNIKK